MTSNGKLLARIDERTKNIQSDVIEVKENVETLFKRTNKANETLVTLGIIQQGHEKDIQEIKKEHNNRWHKGIGLGILKFIFGR